MSEKLSFRRRWAVRLAQPIGIVIRPIIASAVGLLITYLYTHATAALSKVPAVYDFVIQVLSGLPAETQVLLTPAAIGTAVAAFMWVYLSEKVMGQQREGVREIQNIINVSPVNVEVVEDSVMLPGGETTTAMREIAAVAAEKIPELPDKQKGGNPGRRR